MSRRPLTSADCTRVRMSARPLLQLTEDDGDSAADGLARREDCLRAEVEHLLSENLPRGDRGTVQINFDRRLPGRMNKDNLLELVIAVLDVHQSLAALCNASQASESAEPSVRRDRNSPNCAAIRIAMALALCVSDRWLGGRSASHDR